MTLHSRTISWKPPTTSNPTGISFFFVSPLRILNRIYSCIARVVYIEEKDGRTREENRRVAQYAAPSFFFTPNAAPPSSLHVRAYYLYIHHVIPFKLKKYLYKILNIPFSYRCRWIPVWLKRKCRIEFIGKDFHHFFVFQYIFTVSLVVTNVYYVFLFK